MPDNGLANLASSLISKGYDAMILDYNRIGSIERLFASGKEEVERKEEEYIKDIAAEVISYGRTDFVGFKLWTGDGFKGSVKIAELLKKHDKDIHLFAGGPHVNVFRERIYDVTNVFDVLVYGEGEETIINLEEFLNGKRNLETIPNLIFKNNGKIITTNQKRIENLDTLPFPVYDDKIYPAMNGNQKIKIIVSEWSRGCPYRCNFCIHPEKSGNSVRTKSPGRIADEIESCVGYSRVFKSGDSNTPVELSKNVAEEIIKRELDIKYAAIGSIRSAKASYLDILKKAGFYSFFFGLESGSQEILDKSINKQVKAKSIEEVVNAVKDAGIIAVTSIIMPAPGEREETKRESLELLLKIRPDAVPVNIPMVIPHSEWARNPAYFGISLDKDYYEKTMFFSPTLLLPPSSWNPLSYRINGKDFNTIAKESNDFAEQLESNGILTQVIDDIMLMAKCSEVSPREFRDTARRALARGDSQTIKEFASKINENVNPQKILEETKGTLKGVKNGS